MQNHRRKLLPTSRQFGQRGDWGRGENKELQQSGKWEVGAGGWGESRAQNCKINQHLILTRTADILNSKTQKHNRSIVPTGFQGSSFMPVVSKG